MYIRDVTCKALLYTAIIIFSYKPSHSVVIILSHFGIQNLAVLEGCLLVNRLTPIWRWRPGVFNPVVKDAIIPDYNIH